MKKLSLLVFPLAAMSLLASCDNGGGNKPGEVKFSLSSDHPIEVVDKTATVYVDWTPNDTIKFKSFTFTASPTKENTVTFEQTDDPRPMPVKITFKEDITEDISGTLSFAYEDVTAKTKGNSSVNVTIPKEDPHYVNKEEYNLAASLEGVEYLQTETTRYDEKKVLCDFSPSIYYMYAETTSRERFVVKSGDSYSKYTHLFNEGEEFKHEEAEASEFMTPQTRDEINPKKLLDSYSIVYGEDLHYDSSRGVYVARIEALGKSIAFELTFNNKKVTNMSIFHNDTIDEAINYVYEEKTPVLPCTLDFSSETCELKTTDESKVITAPVIVNNGTVLNYKIVAKSGHVLPLENQIDFKITGTTEDFEGEHSYNPNTGEVSITLTDNVTITCEGQDPTVTQDEFNNACSLVGVQLLQVAQRTVINSGEGDFIQDTNIKISDLVYYLSQATDREGEMYDYFGENYAKINQLGDTTCIHTYRNNVEQTDWSTPEPAEAKQWCIRPGDCNPLLIKDMTLYECNPSLTYENFELSDNKYVYTGKASYLSGDPYDAKMELTFANKKLTHCLFTVDDDNQYRFECTYKYDNIVPVWPL